MGSLAVVAACHHLSDPRWLTNPPPPLRPPLLHQSGLIFLHQIPFVSSVLAWPYPTERASSAAAAVVCLSFDQVPVGPEFLLA